MSQSNDKPPTSILKQEPQPTASPSTYLQMDHTASPRSTAKSVSIAPQAETISPLVLGKKKSVDDFNLENTSSAWRLPIRGPSAHRLSGRPPSAACASLPQTTESSKHSSQTSHMPEHLDHLIDEVSYWIKNQRQKRTRRKARTSTRSKRSVHEEEGTSEGLEIPPGHHRKPSDASDSSVDLSKLEEILKYSLHLGATPHRRSLRLRRPSYKRRWSSCASVSSDNEAQDAEPVVPSCDAILDNSKTMSYTGGAESSDDASSDELGRVPSYRDVDAWAKIKFEIVRLAHTLRLQGWRRVPMNMSKHISVERLSGALTNAVYVVSPPSNLPEPEPKGGGHNSSHKRRPPPKLLLRIYGPQVEHLIDRDSELQILQRLARKRIGPRLLGTFANGRFEEYLNAKALEPEEMRNPDTSRQIAKRMRELHDGIELTEQERKDGAFVWRNWDKWVQRAEQVVTWLDDQIRATAPGTKPSGHEAWKKKGFICGVEWPLFRRTVEKYRSWLEAEYGGSEAICQHLIFAHNDTQYGNILRIMPTEESPLLLPANSHKQLVVIDFEYANANLPGQEFANHFTEWCYNYHERKPYACNTNRYPTPEEQDRFIRAYVRHRPSFNVSTPKSGPPTPSSYPDSGVEPPKRSTSSISNFMLDARNPLSNSQTSKSDDAVDKAAEDAEVARLLQETRIWRLANTSQWVAWGIVQAKVPGMPDFGLDPSVHEQTMEVNTEREALEEAAEDLSAVSKEEHAGEAEEEQEEFDYLGYARHRAMFFWGDAIQLGIVKAEDLPKDIRAKVKTVPY